MCGEWIHVFTTAEVCQKTFCAVVKHKKYMNPLRTSGPGTSRGSLPQENLVRFSPLAAAEFIGNVKEAADT